MALTGPQLVASIYAIDRGFGPRDIGNAFMGRRNVFLNVAELKFYPAPDNTKANGVTMNAIIEQSAKGLNQAAKKYYTDSTPTQLVTNGS